MWQSAFKCCFIVAQTMTSTNFKFNFLIQVLIIEYVGIKDLAKLKMFWWFGIRLKPVSDNGQNCHQREFAHIKRSGQDWHKKNIFLLLPRFSLNPWYTRTAVLYLIFVNFQCLSRFERLLKFFLEQFTTY